MSVFSSSLYACITGSQFEGEEVSEVQGAGGEQEDSGDLKEGKVS